MLKILQICPRPPFPPIDGGTIAADNLTQGLLKQGHSVKVLAIATPKHPANKTMQSREYVEKTKFEAVFVDTNFQPIVAMKSLLSRSSYNVDRFYSKDFETSLIKSLKQEQFDFVLFESLYTAPYVKAIRQFTTAPLFLRSHNVEHHIWKGNRLLEKNLAKRFCFRLLEKGLEFYEKEMINQFDGIFTITNADLEIFKSMGCIRPMETIPFGINLDSVVSLVRPEYHSVFHLGAMDWRPNQYAVRWFLEEVWGEVIKIFPNAVFFVAGRNLPDWFKRYDSHNVKILGAVENAYDFMASKSIMVVPLFSGSGMRIKIVEGMALGKTIISTTLGAAGIPYQNKKNMLIAENKAQFVEALSSVLSNQQLCEEISMQAKETAAIEFNIDFHISRMIQFYQEMVHN